jgi:HD-like signal output (HDOD) protein
MRLLLIDQPQALQALESGLAELRPNWSITHCTDASEAIHLVGEGRFDIVACAWRVGRMFGPELLRRVQTVSPDSMRMLLLPSIVDTSEAARQVLASAQQCLRKPLAPRDFAHAAERLVAVRWILGDPALRQLLGRVDRLPSPPRLYMELQHAATGHSVGLASIARLVSQDPGLATRVLRIANSALFNRGLPVLDLAQAVNRVGLNVLSQIVLSCELFQRPSTTDVDVEALRRDALVVSQLARKLVRDPEQSQLAATAALLADTTKLLSADVLHTSLDQVRAPSPWSGLPTEALLGAYLLGLWGLPCQLIEAVAFCREPSRVMGPERAFNAVGAVHVARALLTGEPLDAAYIEATGVWSQLQQWRRMALDLAPATAPLRAPSATPGAINPARAGAAAR